MDDPTAKKEEIAAHLQKIMEILGLDLSQTTPTRVANILVDELFLGLDPNQFPKVTLHPSPSNDMVVVKNIHFTSLCEHHLVPMTGTAHIAYLPKKGVLGLSEINAIVRYFARRPQLQERLVDDIATGLQKVLGTEDVAVSLNAKHFCMVVKNGEDHQNEVQTHLVRGVFEEDPAKQMAFYSSVGR